MKLFRKKKERLFKKFEKLDDDEKKIAIGTNNRAEIRIRERGITEQGRGIAEPDRYQRPSEEFGKRELLPIPEVSERGKDGSGSGKNSNVVGRTRRIKRRFRR